jgi:hypothetical protein
MNCYFMIHVRLNLIYTVYIYMLFVSVVSHDARDQIQLEVDRSFVSLNSQCVMKLVVLLIRD